MIAAYCTASSSGWNCPSPARQQRLHRRLRTRPHHPARGRRAVGAQRDRQGGLRRRGRRPLPQHGARRDRRLRRRGHRLGAAPLLRTHVRPRVSDQSAELQVRNPATEEVIATVPAATVADVDAAVARAARAQTAWAALAPADRARLLRRFAATVDAHLDELARLEVREATTPSATPAGRRATSATCSTTRPEEWNASPVSRSRSPAASTSPSSNRSASSPSSPPGTSRCPSRPGAPHPPSPC